MVPPVRLPVLTSSVRGEKGGPAPGGGPDVCIGAYSGILFRISRERPIQ